MINDTLIIASSIFGGVYLIAMVAYLMFRQYMRLKEKELEVEHARLDDFRAHLERQLMDLNARFSSNEVRWKELNHLVLSGQAPASDTIGTNDEVSLSKFLESHGINLTKIKIQQNLIFVLTPFHDDLRDEFEATVAVGAEVGFRVVRGDEKANQGDIFPQLLRLIVSARVIIANISGRNPNVFYELGIAHALGKPVILLAHSETDVPFDIRSKQIVFYRTNEELRDKLSKMLTRTLLANNV